MEAKTLLQTIPMPARRSVVRGLQSVGVLERPERLSREERVQRLHEARERGLITRLGVDSLAQLEKLERRLGISRDESIRRSLSGLPLVGGAARNRDLTVPPILTAQPVATLTSDDTSYFSVPTGRSFLIRYLVLNMASDADFTTGDEDVAFSIDYTLDGAAWTAVASEAELGGTIDGDQFLQYEPVTLPATVAAQKITVMGVSEIDAAVADPASAVIPGESTIRVVVNVSGTTPVFSTMSVAPLGQFI